MLAEAENCRSANISQTSAKTFFVAASSRGVDWVLPSTGRRGRADTPTLAAFDGPADWRAAARARGLSDSLSDASSDGMAETVLSVDAVVATPVATKRWSLESDEVCLQELVRRSNVASAWRAGKIRRGVPPEAPRAGCKIQCFHNSLVGFADWALLDVDGRGEWRATVRTQKTKANVALRQFSDEKLDLSLGALLERYNEVRVNSTDAPAALFADVWTPWTERGAEACYVELRRRVAATAAGRAPAAGDAFAASDGDRTLACVLECGGDYAGAPWRARLGRSSTGEDAYLTLGELLETFHDVRFESEPAPEGRRLPILRPPRRKNAEPAAADDDSELASSTPAGGKPVARMLDDQQQSLEEAAILERELERLAIGLFAPSPQSAGRRERGRLDAAAADAARAAARAPPGALDAPDLRDAANRAAAKAPRGAGRGVPPLSAVVRSCRLMFGRATRAFFFWNARARASKRR